MKRVLMIAAMLTGLVANAHAEQEAACAAMYDYAYGVAEIRDEGGPLGKVIEAAEKNAGNVVIAGVLKTIAMKVYQYPKWTPKQHGALALEICMKTFGRAKGAM